MVLPPLGQVSVTVIRLRLLKSVGDPVKSAKGKKIVLLSVSGFLERFVSQAISGDMLTLESLNCPHLSS